MRALVLAVVALAQGCYNPNAQSGAYLCSADNTACPDGLNCICNQCVKTDKEAACAFEVSSSMAPPNKKGSSTLIVEEHQQFPVTVTAFAMDGTPATGFHGTIKLSSTWGDVCVGTAGCVTPHDQVTLSGGSGDTTIQLNRETIPPQSALLRAELAGNVGTSGKLRITVNAPKFIRDGGPVVAPLTILPPGNNFGFASLTMGAPSVIKTATGWNMYFLGAVDKKVLGKDEVHSAMGLATSTDGKTFVPPGAPLYESDNMPVTAIGAVSAYDDGDIVHIFGGRQSAFLDAGRTKPFAFATIADLAATPPTTVITTLGAMPDCTFCSAVDVPTVIRDPNPALDGGGPKATVMFFSALSLAGASAANTTVSVVRASSADGVSYDVDPAPILQSTRDESIIYSPRVIVDGTIYKLFYSFTPAGSGDPTMTLDPCIARYHVGYATSSDGFFWVRSPSNNNAPVFDVTDDPGAWDKGASILVSSVLPADGLDPSSGLVLYYSPFQRVAVVACLPNGVGRAERR